MLTSALFSFLALLARAPPISAVPAHAIDTRDSYKTTTEPDGSVVPVDFEHNAQVMIQLPGYTTLGKSSCSPGLRDGFVDNPFTIQVNATGDPTDDVRTTFKWIIHEQAVKEGGDPNLKIFSVRCGAQAQTELSLGSRDQGAYNFKLSTASPYIFKDHDNNDVLVTCDTAKCLVKDCGAYTAPVIDSVSATEL
ncbi:hypothetical protein IAR55_003248 [Kwoniella newhampshirensis]|uniref:Phosphatidylglycerol/phosphatidylinositol transfer protein n=1 Tax=Kwoniella newhampshirensis TaxID=1651941 RepID=A0AAW0YM51_9TREE